MRIFYSALATLGCLLFAATVRAECGGDTECIAVSIETGVPPAHGTPETSAPINFGQQDVGTVSAPRTIVVGAVGGGTGQATLDAITLGGADDGEFSLSIDTCVVGTPSLAHPDGTCTISVTFNPTSEGLKNASVAVSTAAITRTVPLSGGLGDPADDLIVKSLLRAQIDTAKRFSRAQIGNVRRRLESMRTHRNSRKQTSAGQFDSRANDGLGVTPARPEQDAAFATVLARLATEQSLDLGQTLNAVDDDSAAGARSLWIGGDVQFGTRDESSDGRSTTFSSDGVTIGYDQWLGDTLALGVGLGFADGETDIGTEGTQDSATSTLLNAYLNYMPTPSVYLDAVLGFGELSYDTQRYDVDADDDFESGRDGSIWYTSLGAGYEWRRQELLVSPYARLEFSALELDSETESGSGSNLHYDSQSIDTTQVVFGLLAEAPHEANFGWVVPRARIEMYFQDEGDADATVGIPGSPTSLVTPSEAADEILLFGLGTEFFYRNGMQLGLEYQGLHSSGEEDSQILALRLTGNLDGKPTSWDVPVRLRDNPVRVEAGYQNFQNLNRALLSEDELSDNAFVVNVRKAFTHTISPNKRFVLSGDLGARNMLENQGLDRFSAGALGEFQYRTSARFAAPTFTLLAGAALDAYESDLRSGSRYKIGANVLKPITDRINVFGALEGRGRNADSEVFDLQDAGIRVSLDYSLTENDWLRFAGEYREGDTVSSTPGSDFLSDIADALEPDDAYHQQDDFIAYRYEAETVLWTLGYNRAVGSRDSVDIAWRRIDAEPTAGSGENYVSDEISLFYLVKF